MPRTAESTRDRIIKAASRLFYGVGIRSVSVDAVAEKAGVTKKTLYYHFKSKDDLITAYLGARDKPNLQAFAKWLAEAEGDLPEKIQAIFVNLASASVSSPRWRGCGFLRTAAELVDTPGHPAVKLASAHKKRLETWLSQVIAAEGWTESNELARKIVLLIDGAFSAMLVHRDVAYVKSAGDAAATLLNAGERRQQYDPTNVTR